MKTFKICFFLIFLVFNNFSIYAQGIAINTTGDLPHASAILDISTTDKGLLIPRMNTAQRDGISNPANSLLIFNTETNCIEGYINGYWESVMCHRFKCGDTLEFIYDGVTVKNGTVLRDYGGGILKCWMDRNLGASQVATSSTDAASYGDLFQWGRLEDGHQKRTSSTTTTLSASDIPGHNMFIINTSIPSRWQNPLNDNLWQGVSSINNPCPYPWRLPTIQEWTTESNTWSSPNTSGAFGSALKLPAAGQRTTDGTLNNVGIGGEYWSSTLHTDNTQARNIGFSNSLFLFQDFRTFGRTVRCVRNNPCNAPPVMPTSSLQAIGHNQIKWIWNFMLDVEGYKYNTTNDYSTATDVGLDTFYIQTGLNQNTAYTLFVWAYNECGKSSVLIVTASTISNPCNAVAAPSGFGIVASLDKCWLDRNMGATQVATSITDAASYGHLYQWGRLTDGHQIRTSGTTTTLSASNSPGHANFIRAATAPNDWRSPQNNALWQGLSGTNNPCPAGWRIPTQDEWAAERLNWSSYNSAGAFGSFLKLPLAGYRDFSSGGVTSVGSFGGYWSSTINNTYSDYLRLDGSSAYISNNRRALGFSVRCVKN